MGEMECTMIKYPEMRRQLLEHLNVLADIDNQEKIWVGQRDSHCIEYDEFGEAIHFIFDDTCLAEAPSKAIDWFLINEQESIAVSALTKALDGLFDRYGVGLDKAEYLLKPEWQNVVLAAKYAQQLILSS